MAIWYYEDGIGEERAMLIDHGRVIRARIERHDGIKPGLVADAKLVKQLVAGKRGLAELADGQEVLLSPLPKDATEGAAIRIEIRRAAINERMRFKLPLARSASDKELREAPSLLGRIADQGPKVQKCHPHEEDHFASAGWHEVMEEARSGQVSFAGGSLIISVTPAMTLIDVDGDLASLPLALASAKAAAETISRLNLQGSIGIDFPGLGSKAERQSVAEVFDTAMTGDFERTAIYGFGLLHLVKRRTGPSLPELLRSSLMRGHALDLLRMAERGRGTGTIGLVAHPATIKKLENNPEWQAELSRRTGRDISLRIDPKLAIGAHYVE